MGWTVAAIRLFSRGSVHWSLLSRQMTGPCPLRLCRTDKARSPLWVARCNWTTCLLILYCHPIRWKQGGSLFLADWIRLDVGGCKQAHVHLHPPLHREEWRFQSGLPYKRTGGPDQIVYVKGAEEPISPYLLSWKEFLKAFNSWL